ncbi:CsbD family protein [Hyphomonas sp.]|uniref:CsbD family protein n=1 Tax=Hyphomonas sp. TaxID=87 RepID=UPI0032EDEB87|tara:strand:+ start:1146 stop:1316 length:171 start_codon:yes stop_codon:yes gene_type:complete
MDKEHIKGAAKKAEGNVKEAVGKMTDDKSLELKGKADQVEGEARETAGDVKDKFKK